MGPCVVIMVYRFQWRPGTVVFNLPLRFKNFVLDVVLHRVNSLLSIEAMSDYLICSHELFQLYLHILMLSPQQVGMFL
jgi:hypothetical protein